jgi:putative ABC transport system substrate-binding protein
VKQATRREFMQGALALAGFSLLSGCGMLPPGTPQPPKVARIGVLGALTFEPSAESAAFRQALRDLGYSEGQNLAIMARFGASPEGLANNAAELVGLNVDAIVAYEDGAIRAAQDATATTPIVMADSSDPVRDGLIASLARPARNVTGLTSLAGPLRAKRLEILKHTVPGLARVAVVWVSDSEQAPDLRELQEAASALGVQLSFLTARRPDLLGSSFADTIQGPVDGLIMLADSSTRAGFSRSFANFAAEKRLPAIYEARGLAQDGGLMAYGPNLPEQFRRSASYVDRILKGAKPADLPVEQPTRFDFVVNLKTAQTLGLTIPESVLQQATEIIQ